MAVEKKDFEDDSEVVNEKEIVVVDEKVQAFLNRCGHESSKMYLYKIGKNGFTRELCGKYEGLEIPDEHDIGIEHGSGRFVAVLTSSDHKSKNTSVSFTISSSYDRIKLEKSNSLPVQVSGQSGTEIMSVIKDGMAMMIDTFRAMMMQSMQVQQPSTNPLGQGFDVSKLMMNQYTNMQDIMKNNLIQTNDLMSSLLREKKRNVSTGDESIEYEDSTEPQNPILQLLPSLLPLLSSLLQTPATGNVIQALTSNPELIKQIANQITPKLSPVPTQQPIPQTPKQIQPNQSSMVKRNIKKGGVQ